MRETEINKNKEEETKQIRYPVWIAFFAVFILTAVMIWFGVKDPVLFAKLRDLLISLTAVFLFVIGAALAVLFFIFAGKVRESRNAIDNAMSQADGKVEELADKITEIMKTILKPFIQVQSNKAGISGLFSGRKVED